MRRIRDYILNYYNEFFKFLLVPLVPFFICVICRNVYLVLIENDNNTYDNSMKSATLPIEQNNSTEGISLFINSAPRLIKEDSPINNFTETDFNKLKSISAVNINDTIVYELTYTGDIAFMNLLPGHVGLYRFTGDIQVYTDKIVQNNSTYYKAYIIISNINAPYDTDEIFITINGGTAVSNAGEMVPGFVSNKIHIYQDDFTRLISWITRDGNASTTLFIAIIGVILSCKSVIKFRKRKKNKTITVI